MREEGYLFSYVVAGTGVCSNQVVQSRHTIFMRFFVPFSLQLYYLLTYRTTLTFVLFLVYRSRIDRREECLICSVYRTGCGCVTMLHVGMIDTAVWYLRLSIAVRVHAGGHLFVLVGEFACLFIARGQAVSSLFLCSRRRRRTKRIYTSSSSTSE